MTNWKELARGILMAEGAITPAAAGAIKRVILADSRVSFEEAEFLIDLKRSVSKVSEEFNLFLFDILKRVILPDGEIGPTEAKWLKKIVLADGRLSEAERAFLKDLKEAAAVTCPEFDELCVQHLSV